jgi:hypothetical protein
MRVPIESDQSLYIANDERIRHDELQFSTVIEPVDRLASFSALVPVRHPFGEELNPGLRPGTLSSRRRGRHDGTADVTNPVVDGRGVCFYVVIIRKIERLPHGVNVLLLEERANVRLKARRRLHNSKNLKDAVNGAVGQ